MIGGALICGAAGGGEAVWEAAVGVSAVDAVGWEHGGGGDVIGSEAAGGGGAAGWPCWANRALLSSVERTLARRPGRACAVWSLLGPNRTGGACSWSSCCPLKAVDWAFNSQYNCLRSASSIPSNALGGLSLKTSRSVTCENLQVTQRSETCLKNRTAARSRRHAASDLLDCGAGRMYVHSERPAPQSKRSEARDASKRGQRTYGLSG